MKRREPLPALSHVFEDSRPHGENRGTPAIPVTQNENRGTPAIAVTQREKRIHTRFDKAFLVQIGSELYGDSMAIARNVSAGGILVEMSYAPPLGTVVTVHFQHARGEDQIDEIVARAEVKHHHYLNFSGPGFAGSTADRDTAAGPRGEAASTRAIGLRFTEFIDPGDRVDPACLH